MSNGSNNIEVAYQQIVNAFGQIDVEGVTVLTGNNGTGKSLVRKQLPFLFKNLYGLSDLSGTRGWVRSISMDHRTQSQPEFGGLSGIMNDLEWIATSQNTLHSIDQLFRSMESENNVKYLVIDEYEIGCSEETAVALAMYIDSRLHELIDQKKIVGAMIITHSRPGLQHIRFDHFVNIQGLTYEQWSNREIVPTDLDLLRENGLFTYIRDNIKK